MQKGLILTNTLETLNRPRHAPEPWSVTGTSGLTPFTFQPVWKQQTRLFLVWRSCSICYLTHCNLDCRFTSRPPTLLCSARIQPHFLLSMQTHRATPRTRGRMCRGLSSCFVQRLQASRQKTDEEKGVSVNPASECRLREDSQHQQRL